MSCTGPSLPTLSLIQAWAEFQPRENGWGSLQPPVLGATQFMSWETWAGDHIPEMRFPSSGTSRALPKDISGSTGGAAGLGQGHKQHTAPLPAGMEGNTFPGIASAHQMGAITGVLKLFFNCPTKNLMQGGGGTILFIPGVILNVQKIGKALNHT